MLAAGTSLPPSGEARHGLSVSPAGRHRLGSFVLVAPTLAFIALMVAWRLDCIGAGPDPDTDAYGHYVIARQLLETPFNLRVHWVWLPLYHVVLSLGVALGTTLDHVRQINALVAAVPPLLLLWAVNREGRAAPAAGCASLRERALPHVAALLAAATPIAVQLGTSAQAESVFAVMLLAAAVLLRAERFGWAALVLSVAALTRYEAWAVVMAVASVLGVRHLLGARRLSARAALTVLAPGGCALAWAALRALGGEPWFGFIRDNQAFAEAALGHRDLPAFIGEHVLRDVQGGARSVLAASVVVLLGLVGVRRTLRREGVWFLAIPLGVLCFLAASLVNRSQLGLARHWVSLVPFAAVLVAHGAARTAEALAALVASGARLTLRSRPAWLGDAAFALVASVLLLGALGYLADRSAAWRSTTQNALLDRRAAARFLQTLPETSLVVCDEASVEVLSGLAPSRFVRLFVSPRAFEPIALLSRERDVYVLSWQSHVSTLASLGEVSYGALDAPTETLIAIHVKAAPLTSSSARDVAHTAY